MKAKITLFIMSVICGGLIAIPASGQVPVGTGFTYQGQIRQDGAPLTETADFQFRLFSFAGAQIGATLSRDIVVVENGLFTVQLDFGGTAFDGQQRFLEVAARSPAGAGDFVTLSPRQAITATPYAMQTRGIAVDGTLKVGIGTSAPEVKLHVAGGTDVSLAGGGFIQAGSVASNIAIDDNEIMARSNGGPTALFLNHEGGNVLIAGVSGSGSVGIGTVNPIAGLHIAREPFNIGGTLALAGSTHTYISFFPQNSARKAWLGFGGAGSNRFAVVNESGSDISFWTNGGEQVWIDSGGLGVANMPYIGDWHNVQWADHGRIGFDDSTRKHKENVKPLVDDFERLLDAQAVTYTRPGRSDRWELGYIAEDMNDLGLTKLVQFDSNGEVSGFNYEKSLIYLVEIAKAQRRQLTEQAARLAAYEEALRAITNRLDMVEQAAPRQ